MSIFFENLANCVISDKKLSIFRDTCGSKPIFPYAVSQCRNRRKFTHETVDISFITTKFEHAREFQGERCNITFKNDPKLTNSFLYLFFTLLNRGSGAQRRCLILRQRELA